MLSLNRRQTLAASALLASGAVLARSAVAADIDWSQVKQPGKTKNTKFAVNCEMWWGSLKFLDRIRAAADMGYPALEFWPYEGKDIAAIAKLCNELKIEISQFTAWGFEPGMNHPENEANVPKKIEEACKVAKDLNVKKMCVVAGNDQKGMTQQQMHAQTIKSLKRAAPIAEKYEVMLILEPMNIRVDHKGHCLYGSPDAVRICREVGSPMVKINWDLYHMHISEGDLCGHLKEGFDQVGYLQLADHPGRHEPGTGEIHYNRVLKEAKKLGYTGYVGLECSPATTELEAARGVYAADIW